MRRIAIHVSLALVPLSLGCAKQPAVDTQPIPAAAAAQPRPTVPDLSDCILFILDLREFTPENREALAEIFGENVFFEYHTVGHIAGRETVVQPSERRSLTYEFTGAVGKPRQPVPGFFPEVAEGRLPEKLGEALVMSGPDSAGEDGEQVDGPLLQGARRELGAEFAAYPLPRYTLTVVGIVDMRTYTWGTALWVAEAPPYDDTSSSLRMVHASAILDSPAQFDVVREQLALTALPWRALRLRDGKVDPSWSASKRVWVSARVWDEGEVRLRLRVDGPGRPVPAEEVSLSWDGEPLKVEWWTRKDREDGEGYDEVPVGNAFEVGRRHIADLELEPDDERHHIVAYIEGRPEASYFFEWPK